MTSPGSAISSDPWGTPAVTPSPAQTQPPQWEAFDDSFGGSSAPVTPAANAIVTTVPVSATPIQTMQSVPLALTSPPASSGNDLLSGFLEPVTSASVNTPTDPNGNITPAEKPKMTASNFLGGKGASLVNFDNLVSRSSPAGANPFAGGMQKQNPFQKQGPG